MQSNITEIYDDEVYQAPAYDDYTSDENNHYGDDDDYLDEAFVDYEYQMDDEIEYDIATGKKRVLRLFLMLMLILLIIGVVMFGLLPYIESLSQATALPLPPAVQT